MNDSFEDVDSPILGTMSNYQETQGNLITLAKEGLFDVIAHGCNCFCTMGAGIAPQMAKAFNAHEFPLESHVYCGDIDKLGRIDYQMVDPVSGERNMAEDETFEKACTLAVVNCYTQYGFGRNHREGITHPLDYEALTLCLRKINSLFAGKHIGLPQIGCGLAGGDWEKVKSIIQKELKDMKVTIVIFNN